MQRDYIRKNYTKETILYKEETKKGKNYIKKNYTRRDYIEGVLYYIKRKLYKEELYKKRWVLKSVLFNEKLILKWHLKKKNKI